MTTRVVITGLGAITAAGNSAEETWDAMVSGRSGIGPVTYFDASPYTSKIQAEVKDFELGDVTDAKQQRHMNKAVQFGMSAAMEALAQSGLEITDDNAEDIGVIFSSGGGGYDALLAGQATLEAKGPRRITPFLVANFIPDACSGHIAIATGARGPNLAVVAACATGGVTIGEAFEHIRRGDCVAAITGSSEAVLLEVFHATWSAMRALSANNEHPEASLKPFDLNRDGFVSGEGAAAMILEDYEHAKARGANIICEVIGYGSSSDAYDMIGLNEAGRGLSRAMRGALRKADIPAADINYINPHGSGTMLNDCVETRVFKDLMGKAAYDAAISSVKPITGHCMGASGSVEALACIMSIRDQVVPPTINYSTPDPECDLDYVPNTARKQAVDVAVTTSVGLGGHNSAVIFRKID